MGGGHVVPIKKINLSLFVIPDFDPESILFINIIRRIFYRSTKYLFLLLSLLLMSCGKVDRDLSNDPQYSYMVGKEYVLKKELVIFRSSTKRIFLEYPGDPDFPTKEKMNGKFPYKYYDYLFYGFVPAGSKFKVIRVKEEGSSSAYFIYYIVKITESANKQFEGWEVYAGGLTDMGVHQPDHVPQFEPQYAEEIKFGEK